MMETMGVRTRKVASLIQHELVDIIRREINDPRIHSLGMITISAVDLAKDHRDATVYVAFMGSLGNDPQSRQYALKTLGNAAGFIRALLVKRLAIKVVPRLHFRFDTSFDYAAKIHHAIHDMKSSSP